MTQFLVDTLIDGIKSDVWLEGIDGADTAYRDGDYISVFRLIKSLAERGHAKAQHNLGYLYHRGYGVPQNFADAIKWYRSSAEQGYVSTQYAIGYMYMRGQGVSGNCAEAIRWLRLAADEFYVQAQISMGILYFLRIGGVPQDLIRAHMWLNLAAARGNVVGAKARDEVATSMTPNQIEEAQLLARDWLESHQQ